MMRETFPVGPLLCNCTVLGDTEGGEAIVVDPGGDVEAILSVLLKHRLRLKAIVVTHAHLDHIAGAALLRSALGAPVLYHQADLALVALMPEQAAWIGVPVPEVTSPDASAEDGMSLRLGTNRIDVIHTPGHTPGSISLHLPAENLLLAGDTLFRGGIGRTDLWLGDERLILESILGKLLHLPQCTHIVPGHGPETSLAAESGWLSIL